MVLAASSQLESGIRGKKPSHDYIRTSPNQTHQRRHECIKAVLKEDVRKKTDVEDRLTENGEGLA